MECKLELLNKSGSGKGFYRCRLCDTVRELPIAIVARGVSVSCKMQPDNARAAGLTMLSMEGVSTEIPCDYRGQTTGKFDCGCAGNWDIFKCSHPENAAGEAMRNKPAKNSHKWSGKWTCSGCVLAGRNLTKPDFPAITVRNLIYHCCPLKSNNLWRNNVRQLLDNREVFNGRKLIAVSTGEGMHDIQEVQTELGGFAELMPIPNDKQLREVVSFLPLLCGVANTNTNEATFYAHTKGNSTADSVEGATYWRNAGYRHLLGGSDACMEHLRRFKSVGIHKMVYPDKFSSPYPTKLAHGRWMFAGTFFWFRNDAVFNKLRWREVPIDRYGAEAWLAGLFEPNEAKSVYQKWDEEKWTMPDPYNPALYKDDFIADDEVERLRIERCAKESRSRLAL